MHDEPNDTEQVIRVEGEGGSEEIPREMWERNAFGEIVLPLQSLIDFLASRWFLAFEPDRGAVTTLTNHANRYNLRFAKMRLRPLTPAERADALRAALTVLERDLLAEALQSLADEETHPGGNES
jgi:hypothetical protein